MLPKYWKLIKLITVLKCCSCCLHCHWSEPLLGQRSLPAFSIPLCPLLSLSIRILLSLLYLLSTFYYDIHTPFYYVAHYKKTWYLIKWFISTGFIISHNCIDQNTIYSRNKSETSVQSQQITSAINRNIRRTY